MLENFVDSFLSHSGPDSFSEFHLPTSFGLYNGLFPLILALFLFISKLFDIYIYIYTYIYTTITASEKKTTWTCLC